MPGTANDPLVAVDIGNSRLKFGLFDRQAVSTAEADRLPVAQRTLELAGADGWLDELAAWLSPLEARSACWFVGSVERTVASTLVDWLRWAHGGQAPLRLTLLASLDLPLIVELPRPDMVGIDRLLAAVAVNRLRKPDHAAIVVDLGTAITVDLVSPAGAFLGGAILPGIALAARALHAFTDLLPLLDMPRLDEPPAALGASTIEALRSGIYWGAVGGIRQLIELLSASQPAGCQIYLTGGAAPAVAGLLAPSARFEPHLTLAGIALSAKL
ncbi:MAG: type III pantothenate kinase [Pirellulales bacterium]